MALTTAAGGASTSWTFPEGGSARALAIKITAPEAVFERAVETAAPVLDSFEFRTA